MDSKSSKYHNENNCFNYSSNIKKFDNLYNFKSSKTLKILDIGCGDGRIAKELIDLGHDVYGVDCSEEGIKVAKKNNIKATLLDLENNDLPFKEKKFDLILFLDTYEHLYDQISILKKINKVLKDNGKLIISYPNHFDLRNRIEMLLGKGIVHWAHRKYKNAKAWTYSHIRFLLFKEFNELLNKNNFYIKKIQYNFLAGGIIPGRITPPFIKKILLKYFPQLLTGKYIVLIDKTKGDIKKKIYLAKTPNGL